MCLGRMISVGICTATVFLVGVAGGCRRIESTGPLRGDGPVVALVAGTPIYAADVAVQMRGRRVDARRALDDLVVFELLARAATDLFLSGTDGAEDKAIQSAKVERLIEREIEPRIAKDAISDGEVRALYDRGKTRFVHGRLVQIAVLCVFTGARMRVEPRARAESNARALKAYVDGLASKTALAFESIAKDAAWIERKVSVTTVWQGEDEPFPAGVGRAVAALSKPGDTTDLVGDETGYYIALYLSERPPENVSFPEASPRLREEMYEPWRRRRFLQLSQDMSNGHDIQVFPENFALLAGGAATR